MIAIEVLATILVAALAVGHAAWLLATPSADDATGSAPLRLAATVGLAVLGWVGAWLAAVSLVLRGEPSADAVAFVGWAAVSLAAAHGLRSGAGWARMLAGFLAVVVLLATGLTVLFSIAMLIAVRGDLSGPMFGVPVFGVLSGWISLVLYAVVATTGAVILLGSQRSRSRE